MKQWKPDPKYTAILRIYFDMGLAAYTAKKQRVPDNGFGITKMPDRKTCDKYWNFWKAEHVKEHMGSLTKTQQEVKAQFAIAYDKQIMVSEAQIQEVLKYKEESRIVWEKEQKAAVEDKTNKQSYIEPHKPDVPLETLLAKLNELQGHQKMAKAGMLAAPIVNQLSEDSMIEELEAEQEEQAKKAKKLRDAKARLH